MYESCFLVHLVVVAGCSCSSCYLWSMWTFHPAADLQLSLLGCDLGYLDVIVRLSSLPVNTAGSQSPRSTEASLMTEFSEFKLVRQITAGSLIPVLPKFWKHNNVLFDSWMPHCDSIESECPLIFCRIVRQPPPAVRCYLWVSAHSAVELERLHMTEVCLQMGVTVDRGLSSTSLHVTQMRMDTDCETGGGQVGSWRCSTEVIHNDKDEVVEGLGGWREEKRQSSAIAPSSHGYADSLTSDCETGIYGTHQQTVKVSWTLLTPLLLSSGVKRLICHIKKFFFPHHDVKKHLKKKSFYMWLLKIREDISQMIFSWTWLQIVKQQHHGQHGRITLAAGTSGSFLTLDFPPDSTLPSSVQWRFILSHTSFCFLPFPTLVTVPVRGPCRLLFWTCSFLSTAGSNLMWKFSPRYLPGLPSVAWCWLVEIITLSSCIIGCSDQTRIVFWVNWS